MTVAAILHRKGPEVASVSPDTKVAEAVTILSRRRIGAVLVRDVGGPPQGILSERDIVHALAGHGADALDLPVHRLMTRDIVTAEPTTTVEQAMERMTAGRFRHLPVMEAGRVVGIISIGDIVKAPADGAGTSGG